MRRVAAAAFAAALVAGLIYQIRRPMDTTTRELALHRERWIGRRVRVEGRVLAFRDAKNGPYHVLDRDGFRVVLEGAPAGELRADEDRDVSAAGTFLYRDGVGAALADARLSPPVPAR